ncbi:MAG: Na+/H+ antiporter NhaA [Candidatus Nitronauta litoralis]|uniref:Na+/H+ antiporter NhaA n=1 Tax=Candidatus Nitronauta litoralis TaxID=2705533 RepID=A0A7T0BW90_9BACT|nr:MAG: Na+/H+ antiporter NhaA [Candidatus Nitronauta litoralis]
MPQSGELPEGVSFKEIIGVGFLAGIGFAMSIFVSNLAFPDNTQWVEQAKLAILLATFMSGIFIFFWFFVICRRQS